MVSHEDTRCGDRSESVPRRWRFCRPRRRPGRRPWPCRWRVVQGGASGAAAAAPAAAEGRRLGRGGAARRRVFCLALFLLLSPFRSLSRPPPKRCTRRAETNPPCWNKISRTKITTNLKNIVNLKGLFNLQQPKVFKVKFSLTHNSPKYLEWNLG